MKHHSTKLQEKISSASISTTTINEEEMKEKERKKKVCDNGKLANFHPRIDMLHYISLNNLNTT